MLLRKAAQGQFNIIEEFASLAPNRKAILCDHLYSEGRSTFQNTVKLLWPEAKATDMKKLEKFIYMLRKR